MLQNKNYDLCADVLKVAHHGSNKGTTKEFYQPYLPSMPLFALDRITPYGHPHRETLDNLFDHGIEVYTTAERLNIIITSDGEELKLRRVR